jgi:RecQ family ATP-dependent DNA helicase
VKGIEDYVREVVGKVGQVAAPPRRADQGLAGESACPTTTGSLPAKVGQALPPAKVGQALPRAKVGQALPRAKVGQALPPAKVEQALPPAKVEQALPRALVGQALPPAKVEQALSPAKVGQALPPAKVEQALPRALVGQALPPAKVEQALSPAKVGQALPPAKVEQALPPAKPASAAPVYAGGTLTELLQTAFGFPSFRTSQEAVCQAVIAGRDVLLVMPTGAGKSLCYQLPAVARGGTALVISPLIALMEDQVAKLKERNFAVERIHSGRDRAASRQACIDYLHGALQFLFIAPERLRVAGFPEMLAKRKPSLIAIDEAHCISQWGHDFRPDYRMLGQYLPTLRPAPVIALTATATPVVQNDIAVQLGLVEPACFIQGFRRDNLAIEVVEVAPSQRAALTLELLLEEERRPAIVYTPTRAQATSVAAELARHFPCAAYHAGLDAVHRKRVQEEFLEGRIQVMVATIAFGMGIDKPDVRTVIHTALPGSLEAYYQEIGRAGRDGAPSRTILMHSYADRRTHDFFFERDYPEVKVLDGIFGRLRVEPVEKAVLQQQLRMDPDVFDKALEKLWIHGGALVDFAENVSRGHDHWREPYIAQGDQKQQQLNLMLRYAESSECRMSGLVRHFGDLADAQNACGICDFCAPAECSGQRFRPATDAERAAALAAVNVLRSGSGRSTGKLHAEVCPRGEMTRDAFEEILGAMARANFLRLANAVFEKDGKAIPYRKASLTPDGEALEEIAPGDLVMKDAAQAATPARKGRKKKAAATAATRKRPRKPAAVATPAPPRPSHRPGIAPDSRIEETLRQWRLAEAKRRGVPAFRIFSDQALKAVAARRPATAAELLAIPGLGIGTVEKYGAQIYRLLHGASG